MTNWYLIYAYAFVVSFGVAMALTAAVRALAIRWGVYDHPGERKMQKEPIPLLGGAAIFATFNLVILGNLLLLEPVRRVGLEWLEMNVFSFLGSRLYWKLAALSVGGLIIFILGVVDDLKALSPEQKLAGQIVAALAVVLSGARIELFVPSIFHNTWVATAISGGITMFWILFMMNAMNFLDNMDGLSAGVSVIAALAMFLCVSPHDTFVCVLLVVFAGSVAGFLIHNINPARIYMGDAGAMFCGYVLAVGAVLGTFYTSTTPSRVAVIAPLLALSVPLFDTLSVIYIRWRRGESIMKGDKRHFSHRLVALGMTPFQAVAFILLVAVVAGFGAVLLRQVDGWGTVIIIAQAVGLYGLIALLITVGMNGRAGRPRE